MNNITPEEALNGNTPPGLYIIYEDCVVPVEMDELILKWHRKKRMLCRQSPTGGAFLNRLAKCSCGEYDVRKKTRQSVQCKKCVRKEKSKQHPKKNLSREEINKRIRAGVRKSKNNTGSQLTGTRLINIRHVEDIDTWNCQHRDFCLNKYQRYTNIACYRCVHYQPNLIDISQIVHNTKNDYNSIYAIGE